MIAFLIKSSVVIGATWLFYKIFLQKESFFALNRLFLLASLFLAFLIPFLNVPQLIDHQGLFNDLLARMGLLDEAAMNADAFSSQILGNSETIQGESGTALTAPLVEQKSLNWFTLLISIYLIGVCILGGYFLYQLGNLFVYIQRAKDKHYESETIIIQSDMNLAPCSFFKYIFINPLHYERDTYEQILAHEKIHAQFGHSYDLVLAKLAAIVLWFNPFIWLFKREVEKNVEYQTDQLLLAQSSYSMEAYQVSLLQVANPLKSISITTNYNQSLLTQRIMMMKAEKSNPSRLWKYTLLIPLFLGILLMLNAPAVAQQNSENTQEKVELNKEKMPDLKAPKKAVEMAYQKLYLVIKADTKEDLLYDIKALLKEYGVDFTLEGLKVEEGKIHAIAAQMDFSNGSAGGLSVNDRQAPMNGSAVFYYENETGISGSGGGISDYISDYGKQIMTNNLNGLFLIDTEGKMHVRGSVNLP